MQAKQLQAQLKAEQDLAKENEMMEMQKQEQADAEKLANAEPVAPLGDAVVDAEAIAVDSQIPTDVTMPIV